MLGTFKEPRKITIYAAVMAVAALVATLLAVSFSAGPTQAQTSDNAYADPRPCGPEADVAFQPEPHELRSGHYALFDAYWEWTEHDPNEGIMHTNECPPKMVAGRTGLVRAVSNIDVKEAIIHVESTDTRVATVVDSDNPSAEPVSGLTIDLQDYPELAEAVGVGDKVWWLRLDDPATGTDANPVDEASDLIVGFSAQLFDPKYWLTQEDGNPMRYMLETARYRNVNPAEAPHFFAYEAPDIRAGGGPRSRPVLDSTELDVKLHDMELDPGKYRPLEWIFTKEGSYNLTAHLQGFVRSTNPKNPGDEGYDANWKPISSKIDETSETTRYVFQVGDLDETEPPMFGVSINAHETIPSGENVGEPIQVFGAEADLSYTLSGTGKEHFNVVPRTHPNAAQIVLAPNTTLNYTLKDTYDLVLGVSDGKDHEGNNDDSIDHSIAVEIEVLLDPRVYVKSQPAHPEGWTEREVLGQCFCVAGQRCSQRPLLRLVGDIRWGQQPRISGRRCDHV